MRRLVCFVIVISAQFSAFAESDYYYRMQRNDSITVVLYSLGLFPVWDKINDVLAMNIIKIQDNPDYVLIEQKLILPKPNPIFEANYKILADGEIIILSKIRTQKQKEDFLNQRELKEIIDTENPKNSVITSKTNQDEILPRQIKRIYINYGLLLNTNSSTQKISGNNSIQGTNSLQSLNTGISFEMAFEFKHHLYFDVQKFSLPAADKTIFSNKEFDLINFSYFYGIDLSERFSILLGIEQQEKVFFTDISQNLITASKTSFLAPSLGGMYISKSKFLTLNPMLMANVIYRSQIKVDDKTIAPGLEYSLMIGAFYNLSETSHLEFSLGADYGQYTIKDDIDHIDGTDISAKFIIKYGREFFF